MLTSPGWAWIATWVAGEVGNGGSIVVSDGEGHSVAAPVTSSTIEHGEGYYRLVVTATFEQGAANFEWSERALKLADGTVIEAEAEDLGRKVEGSEWEIAVKVDFGSA